MRDALFSEYKPARAQEARRYFVELGQADKDQRLGDFQAEVLAANTVMGPTYKRHGLDSPTVASTFYSWLAQRTWGEPRLEDVLDFAVQSGLVEARTAGAAKERIPSKAALKEESMNRHKLSDSLFWHGYGRLHGAAGLSRCGYPNRL